MAIILSFHRYLSSLLRQQWLLIPSVLRPEPLAHIHFPVDANVSKLARLLRMAGFDAATHLHLQDETLAASAKKERRILLSRDRGLLMRRNVDFGRIIRAIEPLAQLKEVITLLALNDQLHLFSRYLLCNCPLKPVPKEQIADHLKPLTNRYYNNFSQCPECARIYWPGSHVQKMLSRVSMIQSHN